MHKDYFQLNLHSKYDCSHYTTGIMRIVFLPIIKLRRTFRLILARVLVFWARILLSRNSARIQLSYASESVHDGLGAQIQRLLSVEAFARSLGATHISMPLKQIAIHPLDPFQSIEEMQDFLKTVNRIFGFGENDIKAFKVTHRVNKLTTFGLFKILVELITNKKIIHISTCEIYDIIDFLPNFYAENLSQRRFLMDVPRDAALENFICVHFRQGVGGKVVYPGQKLPRELDIEYFTETLSNSDYVGKRILVLTDAPSSSMTYQPVMDQKHLWDGTPKFSNGKMSISGYDLKKAFGEKGFEVEVISGGDPLEAFFLMLDCNILVMSRSSLSYSAAILNRKATIYYPPGFWHPPMRDWNK